MDAWVNTTVAWRRLVLAGLDAGHLDYRTMRLETVVRHLLRLLLRRVWSVAVFCIAIVPLMVLNISLSWQTNDGNAMVFRDLHDFANLKNEDSQRLIMSKYLQKQFGGNREQNDSNWWKKNVSESGEKEQYYHREQIIARELDQAYNEYERACSKNFQNGTHPNNSTISWAPEWQNKLKVCQEHLPNRYYLSAVLQIRIYNEDRARWSLKELKQWIHYVFWAGVQHIYLCDHYRLTKEMLYTALKKYIDLGLITYHSWHHIRMPIKAQVDCYQYMINKYGYDSTWHIAIDMDEYPYVTNDTKEAFLARYLKQLSYSVSELSLHNYLMLGQGDRMRTTVIERITRMTPEPANTLDKPIYRPTRVVASIHHNLILHGRKLEANDREIRLLHYWGARLQNWGPDTPQLRLMTMPFTAVRNRIAPFIRRSLIAFGELDSFSNSTGP